MHPLSLYQKLLCNRFTDTDRSRVDAWIRDFPYFALPYMVRAKDQKEPLHLMAAALYVPDRGMLQHYIEGPMNDPEKRLADLSQQAESPQQKSYPNVENALFSIVDFDSWNPADPHLTSNFGVFSLSESEVNPFTEWDIRVRTLKYMPLVEGIRRQMAAYGTPTANGTPTSPPQQEAQDILDRFLDSPIRFQPLKPGQQYQPDSSAMVSIQENEEIVSETLARIHMSQNNLQEAVRIYEKLRLLFPEKSSYFEAQIKQIKEKQ